jgi:Kef-type K+ transport system membrane component KefB
MISHDLIINLLLILAVAWFLGYVFSRLGLPAMLGQLLAGVLLGPPVLGIIVSSPSIELLAELGIFFVMFHTGLELNPEELLDHIWPSMAVATGGFILPFASGYAVTKLFGGTIYQALFVGMGVSITAIAVQAVILHAMRINKSEIGHIIMGAAIADDIMALVVVASVVIQLSEKLLESGFINEPLLTEDQFSGLVLMAFATTVMAPISLKWAVGKSCGAKEAAIFCRLREENT